MISPQKGGHRSPLGGGARNGDTPDPPPSMTDLVLGGSDPPPSMTDLVLGGSDPPPSMTDLVLGGGPYLNYIGTSCCWGGQTPPLA